MLMSVNKETDTLWSEEIQYKVKAALYTPPIMTKSFIRYWALVVAQSSEEKPV